MTRWTLIVAVTAILLLALVGCQPSRSPSGFRLPQGSADAGKTAFVQLGCTDCHKVKGVSLPEPQMRPAIELSTFQLLPRTDGEVTTDIILPSDHFKSGYAAGVVEENGKSRMPADYPERITVRQLADLVAFLQRRS